MPVKPVAQLLLYLYSFLSFFNRSVASNPKPFSYGKPIARQMSNLFGSLEPYLPDHL